MKRTIKDFDLEGKKVIIRCDLNVPMEDNIITDDTRIVASLRTIKYALRNNAKVILLSHLGKIKKEEDKAKNSLYPVSIKLSEYLNKDVLFSPETHGQNLTTMAENLEKGQVLLIENTRYEDIPDKKELFLQTVGVRLFEIINLILTVFFKLHEKPFQFFDTI